MTTLRVNQLEILAKEFISGVSSGYKDAVRIQNDVLYMMTFGTKYSRMNQVKFVDNSL